MSKMRGSLGCKIMIINTKGQDQVDIVHIYFIFDAAHGRISSISTMERKTLTHINHLKPLIKSDSTACSFQTNQQLRVLHAHHNEFRDVAGKAIGKAIGW